MSARTYEFRSVTARYGAHVALSEVSFHLTTGGHVALVGVSGSGKSTVLRLLAGLDPPSAGEVRIDGEIASVPGEVRIPPHRRGVSMVFQDLALWPNLTAMGNVLLGLSGTGLRGAEARSRAAEALSMCGLAGLEDRTPARLSGGQQQRLAIARAIAVRPALLLLDEPFSGLDLVTKARVLAEISSLVATRGITVVLVTHDPVEAMELCGSALVLEGGRLVESGAWDDLLKEPRSELLAAFRRRGCGSGLATRRPPGGSIAD